jgi:hypothetical protein
MSYTSSKSIRGQGFWRNHALPPGSKALEAKSTAQKFLKSSNTKAAGKGAVTKSNPKTAKSAGKKATASTGKASKTLANTEAKSTTKSAADSRAKSTGGKKP